MSNIERTIYTGDKKELPEKERWLMEQQSGIEEECNVNMKKENMLRLENFFNFLVFEN